jgi:hypothetical protein
MVRVGSSIFGGRNGLTAKKLGFSLFENETPHNPILNKIICTNIRYRNHWRPVQRGRNY